MRLHRLDIRSCATTAVSGLRAIGETMLQVFFPKICANCGDVCGKAAPICEICCQNIGFLEEPLCILCSMPLDGNTHGKCSYCADKPSAITELAAVFAYNANSQNMILRLKYHDNTINVGDYAQWMYEKGFSLFTNADVIVPVPLHRLRLLSRRYNQSALLARKISEISSKPLEVFALKKTKYTPPQNSMTAVQRVKNVHESFYVTNSHRVRDRVVILVDDVVTTGATLQACAQALLAAGSREVRALTLGRTLAWHQQQIPYRPLEGTLVTHQQNK